MDILLVKMNVEEFISIYEPQYFRDYKGKRTIDFTLVDRSFEECVERIIDADYSSSVEVVVFLEWVICYSNVVQMISDYERDTFTDLSNPYGNQIKGLRCYIDRVLDLQDDLRKLLVSYDTASSREAYQKLLRLNLPDNFGAVKILSLLYLFSNREVPLLTSPSNKAVADLAGLSVIGDADKKEDVSQIAANMDEYIRRLESLFGTHRLERKLDRALWVYGHRKI